ncbi:endo alpha-1,4 polygalactosaminidase [Nocardia miyunensis]|uniref:endo alpha-1,4 polygalactosaminidase n=1 Tax=Nocardia miyunensis TaxID=282684 RepID=UPI00082BC83B|nr:endo alpha-1,4 polygalactosaminidase [Nocardia miyunensis]
MRRLIAILTALILSAGCSASEVDTPEPDSATPSEPGKPSGAADFPAGKTADYQLGGPYSPPAGVTIVVRDSTATPAAGAYNICYVNAFQTQPGERDLWLRERRDLILSGADGRPLIDQNWPDELLVDTSTAQQRDQLAEIVGHTIGDCAAKGFEAVEFDNLDSYTRSDGKLTAADNLRFAAALTRTAHAAGLLAGQKNAADLSEQASGQASFDFAIAEECLRFQECTQYRAVYGRRVIDIEYTDDLPGSPETVCALPNRPPSTLIRDRELVPEGIAGYFYRHC